MNKNGPIIIIEDDSDDQEFIKNIYTKLAYKNELVFLGDGAQAYKYLTEMTEVPFIIISDLNIPKINGVALRKKVHEDKAIDFLCIPYIILSTNADKHNVEGLYSTGIQGYFKKPDSLDALQDLLRMIIEYWKLSRTPNKYILPKDNHIW